MKKFVTYGILLTTLTASVQHCGAPPPAMPEVSYGSLRIMVMDTAFIRSISFDLDDVKYGKHPNPYVLNNVVVGVHKLLIYDENAAASSNAVEVFQDRQTDITVSLAADGPYVGRIAPRFSVKTIDDQILALDGMKGKVVLLAFFEHT